MMQFLQADHGLDEETGSCQSNDSRRGNTKHAVSGKEFCRETLAESYRPTNHCGLTQRVFPSRQSDPLSFVPKSHRRAGARTDPAIPTSFRTIAKGRHEERELTRITLFHPPAPPKGREKLEPIDR